MVQRGGFPATEPFNFPSAALPYYNTEWLFAVVLYLAYAAGGFVGVILLKAALASLAAFILWKDSALGGSRSAEPRLDLAIRAAVLFPCLLIISYRFVERPDLVLMVFLPFTIYALNAYLYEGRRYLYALPAVQLLWVNMHPSALLAVIPFGAFLVGGSLLRMAHHRWGWQPHGMPTVTQLRTVALVFAAVLVASLVNPYGTHALTAPFMLNAPWLMQHIIELQPPRFVPFPAPVIVTALLALTSLAVAHRGPIMSILLVAPFVYLGFTAVRFVFLFVIVAAPILARNLGVMTAMVERLWVRRACVGFAASAVVASLMVISLAVARAEPLADLTRLPGFGTNERFLPVQALRYLDDAGVTGRVFNTYHWGGYLTWRTFPRLVPIIDGRGYAPPGLRETIHFANTNPGLLEHLYRLYKFEIILVTHPGMPNNANAAPDSAIAAQWALVYWDNVAAVFLRRVDRFAGIIERDEYRHVNPANGVPHFRQSLGDDQALAAIGTEVRRNVRDTGSSMGYTLLGFLHLRARDYDQAIAAFRRAQGYSSAWHASQGLALAYWQKGDLPRAIEYYRALATLSEDPIFLYNLGLALAQLGNHREAVHYLERARSRDEQFIPVYPALIDAYQRLGEGQRNQELRRAHERAVALARTHEHLRRAGQFNREGKPEAAIAETKAALELSPRHPAALSNLGEIYFRQGRLDDALALQRAALEVAPGTADAHYRLALIHQQRADYAAARTHYEHYVRLEPRTYLSWKAREELSRLPR